MQSRVRKLAICGVAGSLGGFAAYLWIARTSAGALYPVPPYTFVLPDALYAALFGLAGAFGGVLFIGSYRLFTRLLAPLTGRHLLQGLLGGAGLGLVGIVAPIALFSGQIQFRTVLETGADAGAVMLLAIVFAKILASTWCMATVFKGGPVFPLIFAGGTLGMMADILAPTVPTALAVSAVMAGMIVCMLKMPFVVILLLALVFLQPDVVPVVIIATLAGHLPTRQVTLIPAG